MNSTKNLRAVRQPRDPLETFQERRIECAVIGSMILSEDAANAVIARGITTQHFYYVPARLCYQAICNLMDTMTPLDTITVEHELREMNAYDDVGDAFFYGIWDVLPTAVNVDHYASRLEAQYQKRRRESDAREGLKLLAEGDEDGASAAFQAAATVIGSDMALKPTKVQLLEWDEEWRKECDGEAVGLDTGLPELTETLGGFTPGRSYVLAGRTSEGKSALAMQIGVHVAQGMDGVHVFSKEMPNVDLDRRLISILSGVSLYPGAGRKLNQYQRDAVAHARQYRENLPLQVDSRPITLPQMEAEARRLRNRVKLFIVDHARLVRVPGARTEYDSVTAVSRACKLLSIECKVSVLLLAQINRDGVRDGEPKLHHLQSSGALEQDADSVMIIVRENYGEPDKKTNAAKVKVLKNRNGFQRVIPLKFEPKLVRFVVDETKTITEARDDE